MDIDNKELLLESIYIGAATNGAIGIEYLMNLEFIDYEFIKQKLDEAKKEINVGF